MDNPLLSKLSIEQFAAYLDGNLNAEDMDSIDSIVSSDDAFREITELSDEIDEEVQDYFKDDYSLISEMEVLDFNELEIPILSLDDSIPSLDVYVSELHTEEEKQYDIGHPNEDADLHLPGDNNGSQDSMTEVDLPKSGLSSEVIIDEVYPNEPDETPDDFFFDEPE